MKNQLKTKLTRCPMSIPTVLQKAFLLVSIFLASLLFPLSLFAQSTISAEQYFENLEETLPIDNNTLLEGLHFYTQHPININHGSLSLLTQLGLLTDYQLNQLRQYQYKIGPLLSIYELQAVPSFDKATLLRIRPFITVDKSLDALHLSLKEQLQAADHTLYLRSHHFVETKKGFKQSEDGTTSYLGTAQKLYGRYFLSYGNAMSMGFTAEKDAGEPFFRKPNPLGFDFFSFHFFLNRPSKQLRRLIIGDFAAQFGQGLLLNTRFSRGKGAAITAIKTSGATVNRFTAVSEYNAFRGVASHWQLTPTLLFTSFISYRKRDATLRSSRNVAGEETFHFSALRKSGFHRTTSEIAAEKTTQQWTTALQVKHTFKGGDIGINSLFNHFDLPYLPIDRPYNAYRFRGKNLWNISTDYQYTFLNYHFFGETALSPNGAIATVNGLVSSLLPTLDFAIHWRHLPPSYQSLFGQTFSETSGNNNEQGIYIGLSYQYKERGQWNAYADFWKHPSIRYLVEAPSKGKEFFSRWTYQKRKQWQVYLQWKLEYKQRSYRVKDAADKALLTRSKSNIRLHLNYHKNKALELRSRIEFSFFKLHALPDSSILIRYENTFIPASATKRKGWLLYQDILYKPLDKPFQFTGRIALFFIDNYDARIYAYENDLLNQFSIPAYFHTGHRMYGNIRYQANKWLTLEARLSQTYYWNQETIGSGLERIDAPRRTAIKLQIRCKF